MILANKVAIVTGAGRNVGEEIACALVAEGANVALVDNNQERLCQMRQAGSDRAAHS